MKFRQIAVPEVSVRQRELVLFGLTVCKECEDSFFSGKVKKKTQFSSFSNAKKLESMLGQQNFKRSDKILILKGISRAKATI